MLLRMINDVNKALDVEAYIAALALVLTIPDVCAKAEYPMQQNKKRYIAWYDEYIGQYEKAPCEPDEEQMPYLSGEVVYQLRCSVLHQGTPNIDKRKIQDIDEFVLLTESKKPFDIYGDMVEVIGERRIYQANLRRLCNIICWCAEAYYKNNKEKFDFFNYKIVDIDKEFPYLRENSIWQDCERG